MGDGACWTPLACALEGEFDVVMPDARGHGGSSAPHHAYRYEDLANDVAGLVRGLILVDPTFLSPERQREVRDSDVADQHRRALGLPKSDLVAQGRARHPHRSPEIVKLQAEARLKTRMAAFDVLTPPSPEYRDVVSAIDVPSLLVIGDSSPVVTLEMAIELRSLNPRVRIEQVQVAGHGLPFEQPERLGEMVLSFLSDLA
jgi:pimeloyl-ACP methyl ester carboxylesterase